MAQRYRRLSAALAGVVLSTSIVSAQQTVRAEIPPKAAPQIAKASAKRAPREIRSLINGVAVSSDYTPVPNATVRLRNLEVNAIEQIVTTNDLGEFTFIAEPEVPYVVEIADVAGRTVAVGDVIRVRAGEVAGARVALPSGLPPLAGVFINTAGMVRLASAGADLQVIDPTFPKVSPSR